MAETKKLKPAPGMIVRDPISAKLLSVEGEDKELNNYWNRRILAGDVVVVEETIAQSQKEKIGKGK